MSYTTKLFNVKTSSTGFSSLAKGKRSLTLLSTLTSLALFLSGCTSASETFDCEPGKGVGCQSITKVNKMIDQGQFLESQEGFTSPLSNQNLLSKATPPSFSTSPFSNAASATVVLSDQTVVQRIAEQPIRVWVAPYQDEAGNFHEASVVHSVIQGGYWQVHPVDRKA